MTTQSAPPVVVRMLPTLDFGGVESRVALQSELHNPQRYQLRVCALHRHGTAADRVRRAGVPLDVLGVDPAVRNPTATVAVARYLARVKPDVLHASIGEANVHAALASLITKMPKLIVEEVGIPAHGLLGRLAFSLVYRVADVAVGVTQATCAAMLEADRAPRERVKLIYNCAGPSFFPPERSSASRSESLPLRILSIGRLVEVKNHETLIRALGGLKRRGIPAHLTILGDGPRRMGLESLVESMGVRDEVSLRGFSADVRSDLVNHDCFALPSHSEGCSVSLIEAMSSALPPLTSSASGNLEVMGELGEKWAMPACDVEGWERALTRFAKLPPEEREQIGARAQEIAYQRFSPGVYLRNLERLYLESP